MTSNDLKTPPPIDMSPEAITARLEMTEQLRRLGVALGKATPVKGKL